MGLRSAWSRVGSSAGLLALAVAVCAGCGGDSDGSDVDSSVAVDSGTDGATDGPAPCRLESVSGLSLGSDANPLEIDGSMDATTLKYRVVEPARLPPPYDSDAIAIIL